MATKKKALLAAAGAGGADSYWIALLGGASTDVAYGVALDSSDNIIVSGFTQSDGAGSNDSLIVKYNSSGTLQWSRTLGGTGSDSGYPVAIDSSDNIIIAGNQNSDSAGNVDAFLAKYNSSGTIQWQVALGGGSWDRFYGVGVDSSDNIYACGETANDGAGGTDGLIAKYNSSGVLQWDYTLGGSNTDQLNSLTVDSSDNIILVGRTDSDGAGGSDILIAKINSSGTLQWDRTLGDGSGNYGYGVVTDSSDNIYVMGYDTDIIFAKYNSSGTIQWQRTLDNGSTDRAYYGLAVDSSDNLYLTGYVTDSVEKTIIAKYDSSGSQQWLNTLWGSGQDHGYDIAIDPSDNIIIVGYTDSDGAGSLDCIVAKLPSDGSGTGTYGNLTYNSASYTDAASSYTDASAVLTYSAAVLTENSATTLTDAEAVLTEELFEVTI